MKRSCAWFFIVLLLAAFACCTAAAEEAADLSAQCKFKSDSKAWKFTRLTNGDYNVYWQSGEVKNPSLQITSPEPMYGLYLCFRDMPASYELQTRQDGEWVTLTEGDTRFHHVFYELHGETEIRIYSTQAKKHCLTFNELYVFGQGDVPGWVQRWEETESKADILLLVAHPDDELLFFSGAIPTYDVELGKRVIVAYLTICDKSRRSEALNGLWAMGVRTYPVFGDFQDKYSRSVDEAYKKAGDNKLKTGKNKVQGWVTELFRRYQPEVVLTQDIKGEYGHGQHMMVADACIQCFELAANANEFPASAEAYGTWEVKKLYIQGYGDESVRLHFGWDEPLQSQGGKTGMEAAIEGFSKHESQTGLMFTVGNRKRPLSVEITGIYYGNTEFGLYATRVGQDAARDSFLENIQ